jgi:hypothetical protein
VDPPVVEDPVTEEPVEVAIPPVAPVPPVPPVPPVAEVSVAHSILPPPADAAPTAATDISSEFFKKDEQIAGLDDPQSDPLS